jgi:hypothetical protein
MARQTLISIRKPVRYGWLDARHELPDAVKRVQMLNFTYHSQMLKLSRRRDTSSGEPLQAKASGRRSILYA